MPVVHLTADHHRRRGSESAPGITGSASAMAKVTRPMAQICQFAMAREIRIQTKHVMNCTDVAADLES
jgi:hypothetical protein